MSLEPISEDRMAPTPRLSLPLEGGGQSIHGWSPQEERALAQAQRLRSRFGVQGGAEGSSHQISEL